MAFRGPAICLLLAGCGGSAAPSSAIGAFTIMSAAVNGQGADRSPFNGPSTIISIGDFAGVCTKAGAGLAVPSSQSLAITTASVDAAGSSALALSPGRYTIAADASRASDGLFAQAVFARRDASCTVDLELDATAGAITITRADGALVEGDLDLSGFVMAADARPTGDHLTGHFVADSCPPLGVDPSPPRCQ